MKKRTITLTLVTLLLTTLCITPAFAYYCPECKAETSNCKHAYIYDSSRLYKNTEAASKELKSSGSTSKSTTSGKSSTASKTSTSAYMGASAYTFKSNYKAKLPDGTTVSYAAGDIVTVTMFIDGNARLLNGALIPGSKLTQAR